MCSMTIKSKSWCLNKHANSSPALAARKAAPAGQTSALPCIHTPTFVKLFIKHGPLKKHCKILRKPVIHQKKAIPKKTIFDLPVEIHLIICKEVDDIRDMWALRDTCKHFQKVVRDNELVISKYMSLSPLLSVPVHTEPGTLRALASIYPLRTYDWPWGGKPSYPWIWLLQSRLQAFKEVKCLSYRAPLYFPLSHYPQLNWDYDLPHLFRSWCEQPDDKASFDFLNGMNPRVRDGMCEFYFMATFALSKQVLELRRPPRSKSPVPSVHPVEDSPIPPPIAAVVRPWAYPVIPNGQLWDLLAQAERDMVPMDPNRTMLRETTATLLGPFIINEWVGNIDFLAGVPVVDGKPRCWPPDDRVVEWMNSSVRDCVYLASKFYNRVYQLFLFFGVLGHQRIGLIERCTVELKELKRKMAGPDGKDEWWKAAHVQMYGP